MKLLCFSSLILFSFLLWSQVVLSVRPNDVINLKDIGSFWLKNETYEFQLLREYYVPRNIKKHIIYTSSTAGLQETTKRAIMDNLPELNELSEEDFESMKNYMGNDMPSEIRVNKKKRSLPLINGGVRVIPLTRKVKFLMADVPDVLKRGISQEIGTQTCLHIPFFTTCDNSADLETVKAAMKASVDGIYAEIDSYKKTDNARADALGVVLNTQKALVDQMAQETSDLSKAIAAVAQSIQVNAAQIGDGDFQAHSQINYLKRVTSSLLKYSNAMASSDPRTVVAQPALTKLFSGYIAAISTLKAQGYEAIVDNNSTAFTWQETPLPAQSVSNVTDPPCRAAGACNYISNNLGRSASVPVFTAVFSYTCKTGSFFPANSGVYCTSPYNLTAEVANNWIYGPFHKNHYGIYNVEVETSPSKFSTTQVTQPIVRAKTLSVASNYVLSSNAYCVQFMGYKMFSSMNNPSKTLINSYSPPLPATTDCDTMRLLDGAAGSTLPGQLYSLYADTEGVVIPFYSNCNRDILKNAIFLVDPSNSVVSSIDYVCSNNWTLGLPSPSAPACGTVPMSIPNSDVFQRHWVTKTCYLNLEPGWFELDYYVNPTLVVIPSIPRGYRLNQFTINLQGELSSSIEFVYTDEWLPVYSITRSSRNTIIADEIAALDHSKVLFYLDPSSIIDEADYLFGKGINGRDCIQQADTYDYNLLNCFFQNDNTYYSPNEYLNGIITTTGISRFNNKFDFLFDDDVSGYSFKLTPKNTSDFSYSIDLDPEICPRLENQQSGTNQCIVSLSYQNNKPVMAIPPDNSSLPAITVTFNNTRAQFPISLSQYKITAGGVDCFYLYCMKTLTVSTVTLRFPNVEIVSAADLALQSKVSLSIQDTIQDTKDKMSYVQTELTTVMNSIIELRENLSKLDFNVTQIPFGDFTALRSQVYDAINDITVAPVDPGAECNGPWNSAVCWFKDFSGTLITVAIVVAVVAVGYIIMVQTGVKDKICGEKGESDDKDIRLETAETLE